MITYSDCGTTIKKRTIAPCVFTQSGNELKEESFNTQTDYETKSKNEQIKRVRFLVH